MSPFVIAQSEGKDPSICQVQELALPVERRIHIPDTAAETLNTEAAETEAVNVCTQNSLFMSVYSENLEQHSLSLSSQLCCICHVSSR